MTQEPYIVSLLSGYAMTIYPPPKGRVLTPAGRRNTDFLQKANLEPLHAPSVASRTKAWYHLYIL